METTIKGIVKISDEVFGVSRKLLFLYLSRLCVFSGVSKTHHHHHAKKESRIKNEHSNSKMNRKKKTKPPTIHWIEFSYKEHIFFIVVCVLGLSLSLYLSLSHHSFNNNSDIVCLILVSASTHVVRISMFVLAY